MRRMKERAASLLLVMVMLMGLTVSAHATVSQSDLQKAVDSSAAYMMQAVKDPQVGSIGGEWAVIGLARSGYNVPQSYYDKYLRTVENYVRACNGKLHDKKYTEYSRVILALTAIGADPSNVAGYDLLAPLGDFEATIWQGINGPIWALIALDSGGYELTKAPGIRQKYIDEILSRQLDDGGWNLSDRGGAGAADADLTGMALQALAKYQDQSEVKTATDKALACLSGMQDEKGGFSSWGTTNSESCVQVIVALCELGIDLNDSRFAKNGITLLDNLMTFRQTDGSFLHTAGGSGSNQMASEQGLYGMAAALRAAKGQSSLYRMDNNGMSTTSTPVSTAIGLEGKDAAVQKTSITAPGATFSDVSGVNAHKNQSAIEAMASREIITGSNGLFRPNDTMTRAEFAAIVVRALGLAQETTNQFTDVPAGQWYAPFVGAAYHYGLIKGKTDTTFEPAGTISRQEAAVMVTRAAKLCGMDTEMDAAAIRNMLAQFGDYVSTSEWARPELAFCYQANILDQSDLDIRSGDAVKRCEVAQMLFNLLGSANLL